MRIIGGRFKGRRLVAPATIPARPTTDFAKESLFNVLSNKISWSEVSFLDLFSGIGSISLEAASRGAGSVTSVDQNISAFRWLQQCKTDLGIDTLLPIKAEVLSWLKANGKKFDVVFADPPFEFNAYTQLIDYTLALALKDDGIFILEHRRSISFASHPCAKDERTYGEVRFTFFEKNAE